MQNTSQVRFKQVPVGARFSSDGKRYRKVAADTVVSLNSFGRGNTANPEKLRRRALCTL